jgi:hypothetical protein
VWSGKWDGTWDVTFVIDDVSNNGHANGHYDTVSGEIDDRGSGFKSGKILISIDQTDNNKAYAIGLFEENTRTALLTKL